MSYLPPEAIPIVLFLSAVSFIVGAINGKIFLKLTRRSKQVLARLKLQPEQTRREFRLMFLANFIMIPAMSIFAVGAVLDETLFRNLGRIGFILFALTILYIHVHWVRRF